MEKQIRKDYLKSIKEKNELVKRTLSLLINEITNETKIKKTPLSDDELVKIINKEVKKRHQSIDMYTAGNRHDLAAVEEQELLILQTYLPSPFTEDELKEIIFKIKNDNPDIIEGKLIGLVNKEVNGRNNINQIKELIKKSL